MPYVFYCDYNIVNLLQVYNKDVNIMMTFEKKNPYCNCTSIKDNLDLIIVLAH
mgnify:CR=1 FL=1